jgi:hypothetical protein
MPAKPYTHMISCTARLELSIAVQGLRKGVYSLAEPAGFTAR